MNCLAELLTSQIPTRLDKQLNICYYEYFNNPWSTCMNFESIDIRRVANGFVVQVETDEDTKEYVYDTSRKVIKFVKEFVEAKTAVTE